MLHLRHGQWLKFSHEVIAGMPGAHRTSDGKVVGIYQRASVDATGEFAPQRIMVVDREGMNLMAVVGGQIHPVSVDPAALYIEPVTSRDDIPEARLATMNPEWRPQP